MLGSREANLIISSGTALLLKINTEVVINEKEQTEMQTITSSHSGDLNGH